MSGRPKALLLGRSTFSLNRLSLASGGSQNYSRPRPTVQPRSYQPTDRATLAKSYKLAEIFRSWGFLEVILEKDLELYSQVVEAHRKAQGSYEQP